MKIADDGWTLITEFDMIIKKILLILYLIIWIVIVKSLMQSYLFSYRKSS